MQINSLGPEPQFFKQKDTPEQPEKGAEQKLAEEPHVAEFKIDAPAPDPLAEYGKKPVKNAKQPVAKVDMSMLKKVSVSRSLNLTSLEANKAPDQDELHHDAE